MAVANNIEAFRKWAISIAIPQEALPSEDAIKSVFSSRQSEVFEIFMKRIRPRQEVAAKRQHILIKEIQKLNEHVVPVSRRVFLPQQLQTYLKIKDLSKKRDEILARIADYKEEYEITTAAFKTKNIQVLNAKNRNSLLHAKVVMLQLKNKSLDTDLKHEEDIKARLLLNMPVKLNLQNANVQLVEEAIQKAFAELKAFDDWATKNNGNSADLKKARDQLWMKLRKILTNIPNFLLFKEIMRLKEQQYEQLIELNKSKTGDSNSFIGKEPMNEFEKNLMKLKIDALALFVYHRKAIEERLKIESLFCERFNTYINEERVKVAASNPNESDEHIDEVLSEYMMQRNWHVNLKAKNECIQKQIDETRSEESRLAKKLEAQEVLLGSVKQTYNDTDAIINKIQYEIEQFRTIKTKIIYSANLLKHKYNETITFQQTNFVNTTNNHYHNNPPAVNKVHALTMTSSSYLTVGGGGGGGDSFECSGMIAEGKFSSTLLDLETSERSFASSSSVAAAGDATIIFGNETTRSNVPPHVFEIRTLSSMPFQYCSFLNKECAFFIGLNPLVTELLDLSSVLKLIPGAILTPRAALDEVREKIAIADQIAIQSSNLQFNFEIATADIALYKQRNKSQDELLSELLDKADFMGIRLKRSINKCWKIIDFILENPLRHYIPSNITFKNRTYQEYETEYRTYARMISDCDSLK